MIPEAPAEAPPPAVDTVTVRADRLSWAGGQLRAEGNVVVEVGTDTLVAASASGTADELEVIDGVWRRADGDVRFATARIRLRARSGVVTDAHVERAGATLDAAEITLDEGGDLRATGARLAPCRCDDGGRPALSFHARSIELLDADVAVVHGGTVRVFDVPVLPVPWWREPLDPRRFRLHIPEVGYGTPGWSARWLAQVGVGDELFVFGPAWRQDRGFRVEGRARGPVPADVAVAWDEAQVRLRGAGASAAGFARGSGRVAWDVTVQSDSAYAADYGLSFVERGVAWHDSRAVAAWGPVRATGWLPDDESAGTLASLRVRPELRGDGWVVAPSATLALDGRVADDFTAADGVARGGLAAEALGAHTWRYLAVEGRGRVAVDAPLADDGEVAVGEAVSARAELPFWAEGGGRRWQFFVGARAASPGAETTFGELAGVGPDVRAQTLVGDVVLTGEAAAVWDGAWSPLVAVQGAGGGVVARAELSATRQLLAVRTSGRFEVDTGVLFAADTAVAWGDVTWRPGRLLLGGGVTQGLAEGDVPSGSARVGYDDGCSSLVLRADFSPDRELPDVGLALALRK